MKKQFLNVCAALFALVTLTALLSVTTRADGGGVYAILYDDGTLVFQYGDAPESGKSVTKTYAVDLSAVAAAGNVLYTGRIPWDKERESVRVVNFKDKISPTATAAWFYGCKNLERVDNIRNLDTASVTTMCFMFYNCNALTALDVSGFDTANVRDMSKMFNNCNAMTALDVSGFDTANVKDMSDMFNNCSGLTALDVSGFDTANVTSMYYMFNKCSGLTVLDVSGFNTANVTWMSYMFSNCSALSALDVSGFDTAKVTYMSSMFSGCSGLTALDVSGFNTANVTDMGNMFSVCSGLTALDVSGFDTANVTDMSNMFAGCSGLTALDVSGFDTANVTDMYYMFDRCSNLKTIYVSDKFTTASVTNSFRMFNGCASLVGCNGTKYDSSHTDKAYARIDTDSAPGYFTASASAPAAYRIISAVASDGKLSVTLENADAVTVAAYYFDSAGKFLSADMQSVSANAETVTFPFSSAYKARVVMFDSDCRPLCAPVAVR